MQNGDVILSIANSRSIEPYSLYVFSFSIQNHQARAPPDLYISACGIIPRQLMDAPAGPIPGLNGSVAGDARVLKVYGPTFTVKQIVQSSPWPDSVNTLTVSLAANVDLPSQAKITLTGLTGTQTASNGNLPLTFPSGSASFANTAQWTRSTTSGQLVLTIQANKVLSAGEISVVSFNLKNPVSSRNPASVSISAQSNVADRNIEPLAMDYRLDLLLPIIGAQAGDARPLQINEKMFVIRKIGQSTPFPGAVNTLTVTLAANVDLPISNGAITITFGLSADDLLAGQVSLQSCGCTEAGVQADGVDLFSLQSPAQQRWGAVTLNFKQSASLQKGQTTVFAIVLSNPDTVEGLESPQVEVDYPGMASGSLKRFTKDEGDGAPLKVSARAFLTKTIGQSTSFPKDQNTITMTLKTNTALQAGSVIIISNLLGASNPSWQTDAMFDPVWNTTSKQLKITIKSGQQLARNVEKQWSFTIINPAKAQQAPPVSVRAAGQDGSVRILAALMDRPDEELNRCLRVQDLEFTTFLAQQSEALPIAINYVSLAIGTSVGLPAGARITVAGRAPEPMHAL